MRIYFSGICGTAMGNAAVLLSRLGHEVSGADAGVYPPMCDVLKAAGIPVYEGFDAARLAKLAPDFVVVGNALSRGNPEVEWLLETRKIPYGSLPQVLHDRILLKRDNIVVSGTHGKTTTTALCAHLMRAQGRDPGWFVGGVPLDVEGGAHAGEPDAPFVIEGDEYDSAFFDKRSKFIHYLPHVAVVNNVEFDHADIFRDLTDVLRTFSHFLRLVPRNGFVVANGDDANVARLLDAVTWARIVRVGTGEGCDVRILNFSETPEGSAFELTLGGAPWGRVRWKLNGLFNARNAAMAATAAAFALFPENPARLSLAALDAARGVRRRQEIRHADARGVVVEDFGHHPTAIGETLRSLRARYPKFRLIACFEPRSNTARTKVFQEALPNALGVADDVFMGPVHRPEKLDEAHRLDEAGLVAALAAKGVAARACDSNDAVLEGAWAVYKDSEKPCVCAFFSNGAFGGIIPKMAARAKMAGHSLC